MSDALIPFLFLMTPVIAAILSICYSFWAWGFEPRQGWIKVEQRMEGYFFGMPAVGISYRYYRYRFLARLSGWEICDEALQSKGRG